MKKEELDKKYLKWEEKIKTKMIIYLNYAIGGMVVLEALKSFLNLRKIFCWENTLYFYFFPWAFFGMKFVSNCVKYEYAAFLNAIVCHIGTYITLLTKDNYIAIIITFGLHYNMRGIFLSTQLISWIDNGLITGFIGLTLNRMLNELFDSQFNCVWNYEVFKADMFECISRLLMILVMNYFGDYLTKKKIEWMKNLAEEINKESKEKEKFFACVSHELRNPLNTLLACVEILPNTPAAKQGELLSSAKSCGEALLHLIGNILDVSKIKDKKMEIYLTDTDISELMNKIILMHKIKVHNRRLYFELIGDPDIPPCVKLDSVKFTQVLTNLISNSIKFTEKGSIIIKLSWMPIRGEYYTNEDFEMAMEAMAESSNREEMLNLIEEEIPHVRGQDLNKKLIQYQGVNLISLENSGPWLSYQPYMSSFRSVVVTQRHQKQRIGMTKSQGVLKIEIIDSGIGITPENAQRLFQPFVQADNSISKNFGGTGLGLWIAKNIIEMMGGRVQIESEIGQGSNFMIILPLFSGNEEYVLQEKEIDIGDLQNAYKGLNILYVEDICENQIVMSHLLAEMGFEITLANNGAEGLYQFKQKRKEFFNLILTDLRMPNMSGQTMIMKIREYEQERCVESRIPIIILTGDPSENEKEKCINILKADAFLIKPVSIPQFTSQLRRLFPDSITEFETNVLEIKHRKIILIVEDDILLSNLFTHFLTDYDVIQAYSVGEGIQKFKDNYENIFAICLDGSFPDGAGIDILRKCRQFEKHVKYDSQDKRVKVISISGNSQNILEDSYKNLFVDVYLQKPFSKNDLLRALQDFEMEQLTQYLFIIILFIIQVELYIIQI